MSYVFEVGKQLPSEQWRQPGKPSWASLVRIEMSLDQALELAQRILGHAIDRRNRGEVFEAFLHGELREEPEEPTTGQPTRRPPGHPGNSELKMEPLPKFAGFGCVTQRLRPLLSGSCASCTHGCSTPGDAAGSLRFGRG